MTTASPGDGTTPPVVTPSLSSLAATAQADLDAYNAVVSDYTSKLSAANAAHSQMLVAHGTLQLDIKKIVAMAQSLDGDPAQDDTGAVPAATPPAPAAPPVTTPSGDPTAPAARRKG